jgi:light-regulated signal transduction histidine kinase (bacteriophytochrome)
MESETSVLDPHRHLQRLERRLEIFGKICRHDLPNQLVVIRGLVNLLQEEVGKLGVEGQEYTNRLSRAAERALDMMQSLKTLLAVDSLTDKPEEVDLSELAKEWARETRQLLPQVMIEYHLSITVPKVMAPRRSLHKAIGELLRHGLAGKAKAVVEIASRINTSGVEIVLAIGLDRIVLEPAQVAARGDSKALENRLELQIVRELVGTWGGALHFVDLPERGVLYVLLIPGCQAAGP